MKQAKADRPSSQSFIRIVGARENNLKNVSLDIPKKVITVFTGVSGSGKSSLVFDTIAAESQRQLNETFTTFVRNRLPHYGQPEAERLENLSPVIVVDQKRLGGNSRSTVGTITDLYSLLRLLFSRVGQPSAGESTAYSFNDPRGMCPECGGTGTTTTLDVKKLIDETKSLNEGAFRFPSFAPGTWYWKYFTRSGFFDNNKKLKDYTAEERQTLLYRDDTQTKATDSSGRRKTKAYNPLMAHNEGVADAAYEGLVPKFERIFLKKDAARMKGERKEAFEQIVTQKVCPLCRGARLNQKALDSRIQGKNIADCAALQADTLLAFVSTIESKSAAPVVSAVSERLAHLVFIGLGYLSLDRETATLSGGESQRVKMVRHLGSSLVDMLYIFDEPSVGLHPRDVSRLNDLIIGLRDKGNTILVVEHDPDVIAIADHVVDVGPLAGEKGGEIMYQGKLENLSRTDTLTGRFLRKKNTLKATYRTPTGFLSVKDASLHNLKRVSVAIPTGVLTVVTGVAGSGKSSLINGVLTETYPDIISIDQKGIHGSRRSNAATFTGMLDSIRRLFADANGVKASLFSFNSEGACPECNGLGEIDLDLAFMDSVVTTCEVCNGRRFTEQVLVYQLRGKSIDEVLQMSVRQARDFFAEKDLRPSLDRLIEVGLEYVTLGQSLDTFSGGERQRLKLAVELENEGRIYIFDEPTTGLHMSDVDRLLKLLNRIVDRGSTVIVIEHNLEVISQADWIIDMGPEAGDAGGRVIFEGKPDELIQTKTSATGTYLNRYLVD
ncbi:excinuclease ABC subunit UvrA [Larkinella ripae]